MSAHARAQASAQAMLLVNIVNQPHAMNTMHWLYRENTCTAGVPKFSAPLALAAPLFASSVLALLGDLGIGVRGNSASGILALLEDLSIGVRGNSALSLVLPNPFLDRGTSILTDSGELLVSGLG